MRLGRLSEFGFDLVNHSVLEIVLFHAKAALGSGGRVNLDGRRDCHCGGSDESHAW